MREGGTAFLFERLSELTCRADRLMFMQLEGAYYPSGHIEGSQVRVLWRSSDSRTERTCYVIYSSDY